ncbi:MAG: sugar ABC transporter permease [Hyphobacterium sp.]|nr:MAG: sugar ABC transporter permease [Hyphobacterium sp.]
MRESELPPKSAVVTIGRHGLSDFFADILQGIGKVDVWFTFAMDDMQQRYRRSALGLLWIMMSYAFFVGGISFFFGAFSQASPDRFIAYVAIGYAMFAFLMAQVQDGCQVFVNATTWIKSVSMPFSIHVLRSIFRAVFTLALNLIVAFSAMLVMGWRPELVAFLCLPGFVIYLINAIAIQYTFGLIAARYRDVAHLTNSITRIMIFVTPVLWVREELTGARAIVADLNPLTHYIEIIRAPLLGDVPRLSSWAIVLAITVLLLAIASVTGAHMRRRLPYWI